MKIAVFSNWSERIAAYHDLTAYNKAEYCRLHGYDFIDQNIPYSPEGHMEGLRVLRELVSSYDVVMSMGADTLFVNTSVKIEREHLRERGRACCSEINIVGPKYAIVCQENLGVWPINNDVMIWAGGDGGLEIVDAIIGGREKWINHHLKWQGFLWNLRAKLDIRPARSFNSTLECSPISDYQLGDWVFHALIAHGQNPARFLEMKYRKLQFMLGFVGSGDFDASMPI